MMPALNLQIPNILMEFLNEKLPYPDIQSSSAFGLYLYKKYFHQRSVQYLLKLQNLLKIYIQDMEQKDRFSQQFL